MQVIEIVARDLLLTEFRGHNHFADIADALSREFCYRVNVLGRDFDNILINSSNDDRELTLAEYPNLRAVLDRINADPSFFSKTRRYGMLSGTRVKELVDDFLRNNSKPQHFFLVDRADYPLINDKGMFYVRDGMHHLIAYGLATKMDDKSFPIAGYYCTNRLLPMSTSS
jgi:hypothetical protein